MMETAVTHSDTASETHFISNDAEYRKTGVLPVKEENAAEPAKQEPATGALPAKESSEPAEKQAETAAASEAAKHQEQVAQRTSAKERREQLRSEIRELLRERDEISKELDRQKQGNNPPQAEASSATAADAAPVKPKQDDFKTWEEFDAARDDYHDKMADYKAHQAVKTYEASRLQREQQVKLEQQMREVKEKYPEFDDVAIPFGMEIGKDPAIHQAVKKRISDSKVLPELLMVMAGADEAKRQEFLKLSKTDPVAALGEIAVFEYLIKEKLTESKPKAPEKQGPKAPPEPATEVSGKSGAPVDEVEAAQRANDGSPDSFARYKAAANRRDLERARKG